MVVYDMRDQILAKNKCLKIIKPQKKKVIMPDVMLHTKNVMIPVVKPMPIKQSIESPLSKIRPRILKAQKYRNSPALLFSETPSHTLYNTLEDLVEAKKIKHRKPGNQSTNMCSLYVISGKMDSATVEKTSISQNAYLLKRSSCKKKYNTLHFPNTKTERLELLEKDKELCKASTKSIQLLRKCNLSQIKEYQIKNEDKFVTMPKIETPINNIMSKSQIISTSSDYDLTNTVSTSSILSESNFKIESKRTFTNIENRRNSLSRIVSIHSYPSNSEYEINVLHYENDIPAKHKLPDLDQSYLNCAATNWCLTDNTGSSEIRDNENLNRYNNKTIRDIKYSWEDINSRMQSPQGKEYCDPRGMQNLEMYCGKPYDCKIKYSWQVIGTSTQTSHSLLQDLLDDMENLKPTYKMCSVKYSWQIIGNSTQTSLHDYNDPDYWKGILLTPNKNYNQDGFQTDVKKNTKSHVKYAQGRFKKYLILNNQGTQTFAEKNIQANVNDYHNAKYSWHNLIKRYL